MLPAFQTLGPHFDFAVRAVRVIGGVWWLWFAGYNVSVAVAVGFIALAGIAVETAIVMLIYIDHEMRDNWPDTAEALLANVRRRDSTFAAKTDDGRTIILGLIPIS